MPGFTLAKGLSGLAEDCEASYINRLFLDSDGFRLSADTYNGYPVYFKNTNTASVYFEGYIYNEHWEDIAAILLDCLENGEHSLIQSTIAKCDGEFVFVFLLKNQREFFVINDSWGRLPIYIFESADNFIVSREIKSVKRVASPLNLSEVNVAIQLMFGYTFGSDTIWEGIKRLPPHSIFEISPERPSRLQEYFQMPSSGKSDINYAIPGIDKAFTAALANRVSRLPNASLSLSAGLDSRLIAGYLTKAEISLPLTTFDYPRLQRDNDVSGAKLISQALQMHDRHKVVRLSEPNVQQLEKLIDLKQGMQDLSMGFILEYYAWLAANDYSTITGDGGDKFFVDLRPLRKLNTMDDLASYVIRYHAKLSIKKSAKLSGATNSEIYTHILNRLQSYPASSLSEKHAHFTIRERGINWLFEGEDRNRCYCWSSSPYYNPKVIKLAMDLDMKAKKNGALFKTLFERLPGKLGDVSNPNWKIPPNDAQKVKNLFRKQAIKQHVPSWMLPKYEIPMQKFEHVELLKKHWPKNGQLPSLEQRAQSYHPEVLWRMLTLAMS